jgi:hypothetical protein
MKKLVGIIAGLLVTISTVAMELKISKEESYNFQKHLAKALAFSDVAVAEKQITEKNPIRVMLSKLSEDFIKSDNDLLKVIDSWELRPCIKEFKDIESNDLNLCSLTCFAKEQINCGEGDTKAAKQLIERTRRTLAEIKLQKKQPQYSKPWIGEIKSNARINFMLRNDNYPLNTEAVKDYIATFIYSTVFASQLD